jgi:penicillin-binding protein 2
VGGKTGSAQNNDRSAHGLFVSFAPYDDPEIAVCVGGGYASSGGNLAPVCLEIYREYFGLTTPTTPETQQPAA